MNCGQPGNMLEELARSTHRYDCTLGSARNVHHIQRGCPVGGKPWYKRDSRRQNTPPAEVGDTATDLACRKRKSVFTFVYRPIRARRLTANHSPAGECSSIAT
jgi:hypothetical protein